MKLIDVKDTLPVGFIPIQETVDTRESAPRTLPWEPPPGGEGGCYLILCVSEECVGPCLQVCSLRLMPPLDRAVNLGTVGLPSAGAKVKLSITP